MSLILNNLGQSESQNVLVSRLWKFEYPSLGWDWPVGLDGLGLETNNSVSLITEDWKVKNI